MTKVTTASSVKNKSTKDDPLHRNLVRVYSIALPFGKNNYSLLTLTLSAFSCDSTFPHGGFISAGLLLASCAALVATTYSVASCRMVVLTFRSDSGNFEQTFSRFNSVQTDSLREFKTALGLFQWLRPNDDRDWDEGTCVGYQQSMKEEFSEKYFEMARIAGSMSVLLGIVVVLWAVVNSCIAWNTWQIIILSTVLLSGTVAASLSFIFLRSDLCNNIFPDSSCSIDEGGLVLIAGTILWLSGFLITVIFMRTLDNRVDDYGLSDIERARAREMALIKEKRTREKERLQRQRAEERERRLAQMEATPVQSGEAALGAVIVTPTSLQSSSSESNRDSMHVVPAVGASHSDSVHGTEEPPIVVEDDVEQDEYEVYINTRQQRIDEILRDIQHSEDRHQAASSNEPISGIDDGYDTRTNDPSEI